MCMITVYKGSINDDNKIADEVSKYELDLDSKKLTIYPMLKAPQVLDVSKGMTWDESNDTMVIV